MLVGVSSLAGSFPVNQYTGEKMFARVQKKKVEANSLCGGTGIYIELLKLPLNSRHKLQVWVWPSPQLTSFVSNEVARIWWLCRREKLLRGGESWRLRSLWGGITSLALTLHAVFTSSKGGQDSGKGHTQMKTWVQACMYRVKKQVMTSVDAKHHGVSLSERWNVTWVGNNSICTH